MLGVGLSVGRAPGDTLLLCEEPNQNSIMSTRGSPRQRMSCGKGGHLVKGHWRDIREPLVHVERGFAPAKCLLGLLEQAKVGRLQLSRHCDDERTRRQELRIVANAEHERVAKAGTVCKHNICAEVQ